MVEKQEPIEIIKLEIELISLTKDYILFKEYDKAERCIKALSKCAEKYNDCYFMGP